MINNTMVVKLGKKILMNPDVSVNGRFLVLKSLNGTHIEYNYPSATRADEILNMIYYKLLGGEYIMDLPTE